MSVSAWYIGCAKEDVGEAALLTGDRARIDRIGKYLENSRILPENRGLRTVTGTREGVRITATAFGMGGPIGAIVLHELFDLGVRTFIRVQMNDVIGEIGIIEPRDCVFQRKALNLDTT